MELWKGDKPLLKCVYSLHEQNRTFLFTFVHCINIILDYKHTQNITTDHKTEDKQHTHGQKVYSNQYTCIRVDTIFSSIILPF